MSDVQRLAMLALLKVLEWTGKGRQYDDGSFREVCPICFRSRDSTDRYAAGHCDTCEIGRAIKAFEVPA